MAFGYPSRVERLSVFTVGALMPMRSIAMKLIAIDELIDAERRCADAMMDKILKMRDISGEDRRTRCVENEPRAGPPDARRPPPPPRQLCAVSAPHRSAHSRSCLSSCRVVLMTP